MRKPATAIVLAAAFLAAPLLSGCYESTDFTWYEAGVYKGKRDPLPPESEKAELQQRLEERQRSVQTDR